MNPALLPIAGKLRRMRLAGGRSCSDVEAELVMGPGWLERFESGLDEPSLGLLAAVVANYGSTLSEFFSDLHLEAETVTLDRGLSFSSRDDVTRLHFRTGPYDASIVLPGAAFDECRDALRRMTHRLANESLTDAVKNTFLDVVRLWPDANPSDLWAFFVQHAFTDPFNHSAGESRDWDQSWKRTGGWALERVFLDFYNPHLRHCGIELCMPPRAERAALLARMGVHSQSAAEKADIVILGGASGGDRIPLGVVHVKASFAERRTDDIPLSQALMAQGYLSILATMDCKSTPSASPVNRGELGEALSDTSGSSKRRDIEVDGFFSACFSYNSRTIPTPVDSGAAASIVVLDFASPDDAFSSLICRGRPATRGVREEISRAPLTPA